MSAVMRQRAASIRSWREMAVLLSRQNRALAGDVDRLTAEVRRWRVRAEDAERRVRLDGAHMRTCPTALAVADHDLDKALECAS